MSVLYLLVSLYLWLQGYLQTQLWWTFGPVTYNTRIWRVKYRNHSLYSLSQWQMALHCNVISHWLGAYIEWSLKYKKHLQRSAKEISYTFDGSLAILAGCDRKVVMDVLVWSWNTVLFPACVHWWWQCFLRDKRMFSLVLGDEMKQVIERCGDHSYGLYLMFMRPGDLFTNII